jgi:hypothetical protein
MEILLAIFILGVSIVPMLGAFQTSFQTGEDEGDVTLITNRARGTLDRVMSIEFSTLSGNSGFPVDLATLFGSAEEAGKESFTHKGESYTPVLGISDVSGGTGGFLEISLTLDQVNLKALKAEY